jgi:hypothetical protein
MKNPATGTTVAGHCVTPTGFEGENSLVFMGLYAFPGGPEPSVKWPLAGIATMEVDALLIRAARKAAALTRA